MQGHHWTNAGTLARALLAWEAAPQLCRSAIGPYEECSAYHGAAPLLRYAGLRAEPADQLAFFQRALGSAFRNGARDVLVSGAVDEAMPALVFDVARNEGLAPAITVLDRCRTPLLLVEEFGKETGLRLQTVQADILEFDAEASFDIIVTHSFVQHFSPSGRARLFAVWRRLLRRGGVLITVARIRRASGAVEGALDSARTDLASLAWERLAPLPLACRVHRAELAAALDRHRSQRLRFPIESPEGLEAEIKAAGYRMRYSETRRAAARVTAVLGPSLPDGSDYAAIIAEVV